MCLFPIKLLEKVSILKTLTKGSLQHFKLKFSITEEQMEWLNKTASKYSRLTVLAFPATDYGQEGEKLNGTELKKWYLDPFLLYTLLFAFSLHCGANFKLQNFNQL